MTETVDDVLHSLHHADPTTREIAARILGDQRLDADRGRDVLTALFCRGLIDPDARVAHLAMRAVMELFTHGGLTSDHAALLPLSHWFPGGDARAALTWGRPPTDHRIWAPFVEQLCAVAELEAGLARSNALAVLLRLVRDRRFADPVVGTLVESLMFIAADGADAALAELLVACGRRVALGRWSLAPFEGLDTPWAQTLRAMLGPAGPLPGIALPDGWDDLPAALRPPFPMPGPVVCGACRRAPRHPTLLCPSCDAWWFHPRGMPVPTPNPPRSGPPTPPAWVTELRRIRRTSPVRRRPRD